MSIIWPSIWRLKLLQGSVLLGRRLSLLFIELSFQLFETTQWLFSRDSSENTVLPSQDYQQRAFDARFPKALPHCTPCDQGTTLLCPSRVATCGYPRSASYKNSPSVTNCQSHLGAQIALKTCSWGVKGRHESFYRQFVSLFSK